MKQLTLNQFDLQKVKLTGKRGLKAFWYAMGNNNDLLSVDSDAIVHQDLLDVLEQFRVVFATSHEALDGWNHARDFIKGNDNALKNAPHTQQVICANEWNHAYSRQEAAFPLAYVTKNKFWPSIARINNTFGDRNLICTCEPMESYMEEKA